MTYKYHDLKCHPDYFIDIWNNKRLFDIRLNDKQYAVYDYILLREFNTPYYSGRVIFGIIKYITNFPEGLRENFVGIGFDIIYKNVTKPQKIVDGKNIKFSIVEEPILKIVELQMVLERREILQDLKTKINTNINELNMYCMKCLSDKLYCETCAIPLTCDKLAGIFKEVRNND